MAAVLKFGKLLTPQYIQFRYVTTKKNRIKMNRDRKIGPTIDSSATSLAAKGFLRPQKAYTPPENIDNTIEQIYRETVGNNQEPLTNNQKYKFLSACAIKTGHGVPNSLLHTIIELDDAKKFYQTSVNTTLPLDTMQKLKLPKNLHIEHEYTRFHPETDTMFNGITAFPQSSNIVTGLKTRKKYAGFTTKKPWPS